jgi:NhaP-type Na+/H+ and K+/H+ antiporter
VEHDLLAAGHAALQHAHELILLGGLLALSSILAGLLSRRIGAPTLLIFLILGMLAGEDGPLHIPFDDFQAAYLIGSVALAVILFEGGLTMRLHHLRMVFWPALLLATVGVAVTAGILGIFVALMTGTKLAAGLLVGAASAPTDAAAVNSLLRQSGAALPERTSALLEAESGFNDPMSIFLTVLLLHIIADPHGMSISDAILLFLKEMAGGAALGLAAGFATSFALRTLNLEAAGAGVFALASALSIFGLCQLAGASGFLAVYLAGLVVGQAKFRTAPDVERFINSLSWLSQIVLFLMLGLLVTPHDLLPFIAPAVTAAAVLIFIARPAIVFPCLLPFGFSLRETTFSSWVGLRGAVPIYISFLPALVDPHRDAALFAGVFVLVIASLIIQGWTVGASARLLGFGKQQPRVAVQA